MTMMNFNPITGNRFFFGPSDQEVASQKFYNEVGGLSTDIQNRFNNNKSPFEFGDISSKVGDIYGGYRDIINNETKDQIAEQQGKAGESLASRGITGGSVVSNTQSKIASDINKSKTNALANLGVGESSTIADLMQYFNNLDLSKTKAATDVDFGNISNLFRKYGLKGGAIAGLSDDTGLDDLLAIFNTAGNVAKGVGSLAFGGGG